jgi:hypothetical protein
MDGRLPELGGGFGTAIRWAFKRNIQLFLPFPFRRIHTIICANDTALS